MKIWPLIASIAFVTSVHAQTPYAGMQTRPIKALSEQQVADLGAGRGLGLALAAELNQWTTEHAACPIDVIGPAPCFAGKVDNRFFWQILLRGADVHPILAQVPRPWVVDVDPVNLL